jgi:hypothetical protein
MDENKEYLCEFCGRKISKEECETTGLCPIYTALWIAEIDLDMETEEEP